MKGIEMMKLIDKKALPTKSWKETAQLFSDDIIMAVGTNWMTNVAEAENRELLSIINAVRNAPEIDPIHVAGGCYCHECAYYYEYEEWDRNTQKSYKAYECKMLKRDFGPDGFCCGGKVKNNNA